jgi:hypothetical protein
MHFFEFQLGFFSIVISFFVKECVATLTLGSQPKQRLAKVRVESEAQESHFMLMGV